MNIMRPVAAAVIASSLSIPALAETQDSIYLNPFAGYQLFDDKRDLNETGTFGFGLEYRFLPNWAVEAVYSRASANQKYVSGSSDFEEIRVDGLYYFAGPDAVWNPYVAFGAGHADFGVGEPISYNTAGADHDETRVNIGGGVRYNVTDMVSLRGDLRQFHGIDDSTFDTTVSLGLSLAFHRQAAEPSPAPKPAPASTPEPKPEPEPDVKAEPVIETVETMNLNVQFPTNSAEIGATYDAELRRVAEFMEANPETIAEIAGHSDNIGNANYNQQLSERRAQSVADRLISIHGIEADRVSAVGYGEVEPVVSNDTAAGRAQNRRVEARIQVLR